MASYFWNELLKYLGRYSNNHKTSAGSPAPLNGLSGTEILMAALCETEGRHNGRRGCAFDNELKGCQHQETQGLRVLLMPSWGTKGDPSAPNTKNPPSRRVFCICPTVAERATVRQACSSKCWPSGGASACKSPKGFTSPSTRNQFPVTN